MGLSNDQDPTTRAERREEELERRRRRSPLGSGVVGGVVGGGVVGAMTGRKGDYADQIDKAIEEVGSVTEKAIEVGGLLLGFKMVLKSLGKALGITALSGEREQRLDSDLRLLEFSEVSLKEDRVYSKVWWKLLSFYLKTWDPIVPLPAARPAPAPELLVTSSKG